MSKLEFKTYSFYGLIAFFTFFIFLSESAKLNEAQKSIAENETKIGQNNFLAFACKAKTVCKNYHDIRYSCAEAGNTEKCTEIKMQGVDTSMCLDNGEIVGLNDTTRPSFVQCTGFKAFEFLGSLERLR